MSEFSVHRTADTHPALRYCLILDGRRIAGGKPDYRGNNHLISWKTSETYGPVGELEAENAKLRELLASTISNYADGYMDGTSARYPCDLCDESSMQQCDYQHDRQCPFYRQLRELGVEVDE